jgi:nicotinamidase-related amidase
MRDAGDRPLPFGSDDLRLPDALRGPLRAHLADLRARYRQRGWGGPVGYGRRPALIVIDLALAWTDPRRPELGSAVDSVVDATARVLDAARAAGIFVVFTTWAHDPAVPPSPHDAKSALRIGAGDEKLLELDPRVGRRPTELLLPKRYASAFKGTNLHEMLAGLSVDTLIVTGLSTSHCVYATCRDATDSFRVIVPREAVGERCELFHEVNLLDIELDLGDVVPVEDVVRYLAGVRVGPGASTA